MSLQYIIDGYNITNNPSFRQYATRRISDSRIRLLEFIRINKPCGSPKNKITVIFDGHSDGSCAKCAKIDKTNINIVFSRRDTADEQIKKIVEESGNPKNIIVVSDDKEIRFFVKSVGAKVMGVEEFINPEEKSSAKRGILLKPELTYSQIHKINQELRKIWLK